MFDKIFEFEEALAKYTGAKYAVMTDCCTHAIELCFRHDQVKICAYPAYTYLSIPQLMHRLGVNTIMLDIPKWIGEYQFQGTRIWDSARLLRPGMHRPGQLQCLSFGYSKPLDAGRGGAILMDNLDDYRALSAMRYDGRDLTIGPWHNQQVFKTGYHYRPTPEEAQRCLELLRGIELLPPEKMEPKYVSYPDCRKITIIP